MRLVYDSAMKKILKIAGFGIVALVPTILLMLRVSGYEPRDQSPGLWLGGDLVTEPVSDWSFTDQHGEIFVQTRTPWLIPHSVTVYCATYDNEFYLFSAYYGGGEFPDTRRWNVNAVRDPRVRLKIGERLFDVSLDHVDDDGIRTPVHQAFVDKYPQWSSPGLENVHIFRVEPQA